VQVQEKYAGMQLVEIAEEVASQWKICAPFPPKHVLAKYEKWMGYTREIEHLKRIAASPACRRIRTVHGKLEAAVRKRDRLIVPRQYISWAHIAAFCEKLTEREVEAKRSGCDAR
jgi:hypothetical protein